ncbi:MAG: alpha/beta hydrolase [Bacteroidota bacterium]
MESTSHLPIPPRPAPPEAATRPRKSTTPLLLRLVRLGFATLGRLFPRRAAQIAVRLFSTPRKRARHQASDALLERAEIFEFLYADQLLKGYQWGTGERTVLLVHGWESRGTALRSFVPGLLAEGFRVVAFDGPAHGNSGGKETNLPHFGGAIRAIIHRLGGVYGIIAHSFGGASTVFALSKLDPSIQIDRLVMVASPSDIRRVLRDFLDLIQAPKAVDKAFWRLLQRKFSLNIEEVKVSQLYDQVQVDRLLLLHDEADEVVPFAESQDIVRHWPNSRLLSTSGQGHYRLMKRTEVVECIVDFISEK